MSYVNKVVDKVYLINLDRDTERLKKMTMQLTRLNIEFTRFPAVLGSEVKTSHHLTEFCLKYCTDGIKGCALSHKTIWEDMLKNNYKHVLVLEDDAVFADDFEHMFKTGWDQVPKDFDVWYLGCNFKCTDTQTIPTLYNKALGHTPQHVDTHIQRVYGSVGTHGYVISNKCARAFKHLPIYTHIDAQMTVWLNKHELTAYSVKPLIINTPQQEEHSGSNLAESYPYMLNGALRKVPFSDTVSLDWGASENFAKICGHNVNTLIFVMVLLVLLTYPKYYFLFAIWLLAEFLYSKDAKNTAKFATFIGSAMVFKWVFHATAKEAETVMKRLSKGFINKAKSYFH
jgi:GR25 family glycosyltransferase involved in LPS biosynthesis